MADEAELLNISNGLVLWILILTGVLEAGWKVSLVRGKIPGLGIAHCR
jgi:hypothetical protein